MTAINPVMASANSNIAQFGATPTPTSANAENSNCQSNRRLRSTRSPRGTINSRPTA
ncbi:hypothetical protein D3C80_2014570 [compost metagenome]